MASSRRRQTYAQRVTNRIPATLAAHPGWTEEDARRYLRGHGAPGQGITPEHGGAGRRRPEPGQHRRVTGEPGGVRVEITYRDRVAINAINRAATHDQRVQINTHTTGAGWQIVGQTHRGYSAGHVADVIARHNGNLRAAIAELVSDSVTGRGSDFDLDGYDTASEYADAVDDWQVVPYETAQSA